MAATYSPNLVTALDRVRHALGDIDTTNPLRPDETIAAILAVNGTSAATVAVVPAAEDLATALLAEGLAAEYARKPDAVSDEDGSISWRDRVKTWLELASRLRSGLAGSGSGSGTWSSDVMRDGDEARSEYYRY